MSDFLTIPGNLRNIYMPFTQEGVDYGQYSFKKFNIDGVVNIFPFSSNLSLYLANDYGIQTAWNGKYSFEKFLDMIPAVEIREFQPDTKLTQALQWFSYFKKGFDAAVRNVGSFGEGGISQVYENFKTALGNFGKKLEDLTSGAAGALQDVFSSLPDYNEYPFRVGEDKGWAILCAPWVLYYQLMRTTTTNVYEIPYSGENSFLYGDGRYGWKSDRTIDLGSLGAISSAAGNWGKKAGEQGTFLNALGLNAIKTNIMPAFNPNETPETKEITVKVNLVNDSKESAVNNFLFVHNLFGNVRWIQYGFVQASSALYDVKVPGANRYWMCTGTFTCDAKGILRQPSKEITDAIINGYITKNESANTIDTEFIDRQYRRLGEGVSADDVQRRDDEVKATDESRSKNAERLQQEREALDRAIEAARSPYDPLDVSSGDSEGGGSEGGDQGGGDQGGDSNGGDQSGITQIAFRSIKNFRAPDDSSTDDQGGTDQGGTDQGGTDQGEAQNEQTPKNSTVAVEDKGMSPIIFDGIKLFDEKIYANSRLPADSPLCLFEKLIPEELQAVIKDEKQLKAIQSALNNEDPPNGVPDLRAATESELSTEAKKLRNEIVTPNTMRKVADKLTDRKGDLTAAEKEAKDQKRKAKVKTIVGSREDAKNTGKITVSYVDDNGERQTKEVSARKFPFQDNSAEDVEYGYLAQKIRIPDVYEISMTFKPLLPDSFNNYIFGWRERGLDPFTMAKNMRERPGLFEQVALKLEEVLGGK